MSNISIDFKKSSYATTLRTDNWWVESALIVFGLTAFVIYSIWASFQASHYMWGPYLSPFYSPVIFVDLSAAGRAPLDESWFGEFPSWWPSFLPASPAFLIVAFPLVFRFTCYYYRKAYYRAFAGSPSACSVAAIPQKPYKGETGLLIFQNIHRYTLYFALIYIFILYYDGFKAFFYHGEFGIGVGTIILLINPTLLAAYTFGCHSFRHLVGGQMDCMSCSKVRYGVWKKVSILNGKHQLWAWVSLIFVGFTDVYVRMVSMGIWHDFNTWGSLNQ